MTTIRVTLDRRARRGWRIPHTRPSADRHALASFSSNRRNGALFKGREMEAAKDYRWREPEGSPVVCPVRAAIPAGLHPDQPHASSMLRSPTSGVLGYEADAVNNSEIGGPGVHIS